MKMNLKLGGFFNDGLFSSLLGGRINFDSYCSIGLQPLARKPQIMGGVFLIFSEDVNSPLA